MAQKSNNGQTENESMRFGGRTLDELDPRARAEVQGQLAAKEKREKRKEILSRYPLYNTAAMSVGISNAEKAITRFEACISKERATITEFTIAKGQCEQRDKELEAAGCEPR